MFRVEAVRGLLASGRLPVNVKILIEGEEEVGSPSSSRCSRAERDRVACDAIAVSDTDMWVPTSTATLQPRGRRP